MSDVRSLRTAFPGTAWKAAFAIAVMRLLPELNPDAADEASDQAFSETNRQAPESAALTWVAEYGKRNAATGLQGGPSSGWSDLAASH